MDDLEREREAVASWLLARGERFAEKAENENERLVPRLHDQWVGEAFKVAAAQIKAGKHRPLQDTTNG